MNQAKSHIESAKVALIEKITSESNVDMFDSDAQIDNDVSNAQRDFVNWIIENYESLDDTEFRKIVS